METELQVYLEIGLEKTDFIKDLTVFITIWMEVN